MKTRGRGRKSLLNAKLQKKICSLLSCGNTIRTVADAAGISQRVYFEWCERHPHFAQATTRARANAKIKLVSIITEAAKIDARHAEWLLERSHPQEYGKVWRSEPGDLETGLGEPTTVILNVQRDAESDAAAKLFGKRPER
jgi:hypothetical protein